jgi:hypothetical protein
MQALLQIAHGPLRSLGSGGKQKVLLGTGARACLLHRQHVGECPIRHDHLDQLWQQLLTVLCRCTSQARAARLLWVLLRREELRKHALDAGGISCLMGLLSRERATSGEVRLNAMRALARLACGSGTAVQAMQGAGLLDRVMPVLLEAGAPPTTPPAAAPARGKAAPQTPAAAADARASVSGTEGWRSIHTRS